MNKVCRVCQEDKDISAYGQARLNICRKCNAKRNRSYMGISDHLGDDNTREGAIELLKLIGYNYYHPTKTIHQQFIERNYEKLGMQKPLD